MAESKKALPQQAESMPLSGHLKELRNRLAVCLLALLVCCIVFLNYAETLVTLLTDMGKDYGYRYVYIAPQELLMQYFKVTVIAAVCVCLPLLLYQVWAFIRPGLSRAENLTVLFCLVFGLACFVLGLYFAYRVTLPFMLYFLIHVGTTGTITATISVESYINFLLTVFIIFGCIFEMPMLTIIFTNFGFLKPYMMRKAQKVVVVLVFVVAAVITPPDIISQVMVALPMLALYQISIFICLGMTKFAQRKTKRRKKTKKVSSDAEQKVKAK